MKLTIVCGHYIPELGYLEVHLARAFQQLEHEVSIVTTTVVPVYVSNKFPGRFLSGRSVDEGVMVHRLKPFFSLGQLVWARHVRRTLTQINPDLVVVIGLGKVFPKPILRSGNYPLAILLGDNQNTYLNLDWKQRLLRFFFKKPVYEKAMRVADKVFTYTPETADVVPEWISVEAGKLLQQKQVPISLGFDHQWFYHSEELREFRRREFKLQPEEVLVITTARMGGNKNFDPLFQAVEELVAQGEQIKCLIVGLVDDEIGRGIRSRLEKSPMRDAFFMKPFVPREELNALYNAADIGFWPITAISVFEGMGTGLYLLLPPSKSLEHLELNGEGGMYYGNQLSKDLQSSLQQIDRIPRSERATKAVEKFSYQSITRTILQSMQSG